MCPEPLMSSTTLPACITRMLPWNAIGVPVADVMDVAAVRDVRGLLPVCVPGVLVAELFVGAVWVAAGLGEGAVARLLLLDADAAAAASPARGKLDTLLTFVAESRVLGPLRLRLGRLLAVHVRGGGGPEGGGPEPGNRTFVRAGVRDFTPAFRQWCFAAPASCHLEYLSARRSAGSVHELASCGAAHQRSAVQWLRDNYGVVHDAGHVAAVCAQQASMLPFASRAVLVNTMKYTSRHANRWDTYQQPQAAVIRSQVWADFQLDPE